MIIKRDGKEVPEGERVQELIELLRPVQAAPTARHSITKQTLPVFSLAVGSATLLLSGQVVTWPFQSHIGLAVVVACLPTGLYYIVKATEVFGNGYLRIIQKRNEMAMEIISLQNRLDREARQEQHAQHVERMQLNIRRAELRVQEALYQRRAEDAMDMGRVRRENPNLAASYDNERSWWRYEVLSVLYAPENLDKTSRGTWTGGQPITIKKLGRERFERCRSAGLIYLRGESKQPQWSTELAPDENRAMELLEAAGVFRITDKRGE